MSSVCEFFSLIAAKRTTPETVVMVRLRCKSWQCPHCAKENRKMWGKHLRKVLPRITENWWFVTLTAHEKLRTADASLANIRNNIDALMKRLNRVYENVEYVRVYEVHKTGAFHAHLLVSGLSARVQKHTSSRRVVYWRETLSPKGLGNLSIRTWFRRTARSLGMGYMVDVQKIDGLQQATGYVVKYLTKDAQNFVSKGLRRIQTSRRIGSPRSSGDGTWQCKARVFRQDVPEGTRLYDADRKVWVPGDYWAENLTYPKPNSST